MAQKIEGSTDKDLTPGRPLFFAGEMSGRPATLVIHEGKAERVFTESEVKALAKRILKQAMVIPGDDSHYPFQAVETEDVVKAFADAGVVIDPA